jgi:hypothetical protein
MMDTAGVERSIPDQRHEVKTWRFVFLLMAAVAKLQ